ncbi:hypothetical protein B0H17DRAFT_642164 [Mycena rosella]|uniref:Uncharacterized protein n=1 Tax=Mycena rosella TaxID=1033263 RepID=A0AAD7GI56_MYCRO|nr:hypothetical protein B0H17DRAFT_642164 [Mycena rosella]
MPDIYGVHHGPNEPAYLASVQTHQAQRQAQRKQSSESSEEEEQDGPTLDIDEQSPDEDERSAEHFLRQGPDVIPVDPALTDRNASQVEEPVANSVAVNVLSGHWDRNRHPRAPDPDVLWHTSHSSSSIGSRRSGAQPTQPPSPTASSDSESSAMPSSRSRARRNSYRTPTIDNAKPHQLRYYIYLISEHAFPSTVTAQKQATECISEAIITFKEENAEDPEPECSLDKHMSKLFSRRDQEVRSPHGSR